MSNVYLILAYGLLWGIMALYAVGIHQRQRRLEVELEELKESSGTSVPSTDVRQTIKSRNMTIGEALFSFKGRMCRSDYWLKGFLPLLPVGILINVLMYAVGTEGARATALVLSLLSLWPTLALALKRFHDRNHSAWFLLVLLIPLAGPLWFLGEVWFLRGTIGPNRFGDDPLQDAN